ncbi:GNAT family N-acetyltransferase [Nesterenkonia xinjiangensis]|uniref:RimJ/RimL family protein N-acetyltransferase n=1 Tax=Nesterenkonia xinjiangensis TaxID=225327 RepID=A0A7Z0GIT6_9MICC|nr:GNAT family protein [Nesterenkonia xinjiangensis]NYJ76784.1 RimJ/RimL family protein N-acetyltransferase [Nesterenkonia xinjiangensis]
MGDFDELRTWAAGLLRGEVAALRATVAEDLPILAEWWNQPDVALFQQPRIVQQPRAQVEELFTTWSRNDSPGAVGYTVTRAHDGEVAGHVSLHSLTVPARIATLGIVLGPPAQGQGLGEEAVSLMLRLAFDEMGARKVELKVFSFNDRAKRLYDKLGFCVEGRRREAVLHGGRFHDEISMGLLEPEYRAWSQD